MKKVIGLLGLLALLLCQAIQAQELTGTILKDGKALLVTESVAYRYFGHGGKYQV